MFTSTSAPGTAAVPSLTVPRAARAGHTVNDVHSQLNATTVRAVETVETVAALQDAVRRAAAAGTPVAIAGGRHAMGGQQFKTAGLLLDMRSLTRVVDLDAERGLVTVEAGIDWPRLVNHLLWAGAGRPDGWSIVQKQTGADRLTIGGALSANIHGRGLTLPPIVGDVESFDIVDPAGRLVRCSRTSNAELFALAIGGYGLFGVIARVTLRLARRRLLERRVALACADNLPELFERRIQDGYEYGDFQFATDPRYPEFLRTGVLSCYRPADPSRTIPAGQRALGEDDWARLLRLAHIDKSRAFDEYSRFYLSTDRQLYWSDTHQLASYSDGYHDRLDRDLAASVKGSEMIGELYVPRQELPAFLARVRADARRRAMDVIYGTIRIIEQDDESVLAWARRPWACVVLNLHVDHAPDGIRKAASDFRSLIAAAADRGGTYYLTYHRWATPGQIEQCHPRMREFLQRKRAYDPQGLFTSDWHDHHVRALAV
jgi:FAD/FMN-containing dehydrogenase